MKNLFVVFLLFTGCISHNMKSFIGHSSAELAASWGSPSERVSDGAGGEVWIYYQQRTVTIPGRVDTTASANGDTVGSVSPYSNQYRTQSSASGQATTTYIPAQQQTFTNVRSFFVSHDGVVTGFRWKGM